MSKLTRNHWNCPFKCYIFLQVVPCDYSISLQMKKLVVRKQTLQLISLKDKTNYIILVTNYISCSKIGCVWSYRFQHNANRKTLNTPQWALCACQKSFRKSIIWIYKEVLVPAFFLFFSLKNRVFLILVLWKNQMKRIAAPGYFKNLKEPGFPLLWS